MKIIYMSECDMYVYSTSIYIDLSLNIIFQFKLVITEKGGKADMPA